MTPGDSLIKCVLCEIYTCAFFVESNTGLAIFWRDTMIDREHIFRARRVVKSGITRGGKKETASKHRNTTRKTTVRKKSAGGKHDMKKQV